MYHVPFSPYFYAMFTSDVLESRQNSITLKSMYPKSVELLIEFAYTAQIRITEGNVHATSKSVSLKKNLLIVTLYNGNLLHRTVSV